MGILPLNPFQLSPFASVTLEEQKGLLELAGRRRVGRWEDQKSWSPRRKRQSLRKLGDEEFLGSKKRHGIGPLIFILDFKHKRISQFCHLV